MKLERLVAGLGLCAAAACHDYDGALAECIDAGRCGGGGTVVDPRLELDVSGATAIDFMSVPVGSTKELDVPVRNGGDSATGVVSTSLSGAAFTVVSDTCKDAALAAKARCTVRVRFAPSTASAASGQLTLQAGPGGTLLVALQGVGVTAASLTTSPQTVELGPQTIDTSGPSQRVTVSNLGTQTATSLAVALSGGMAAQFEVVGNTCGSMLSGGGSCTVDLRFKPTAVGAASATLEVQADGASASSLVTGTGLAVSDLELMPPTFDFAATGTGATRPTQLTVKNTGTVATGALTVTLVGANAGHYGSSGCSGTALNPNESCTVTVTFHPTVLGALPVALQVSGTPGGTVSAGLTGTGVRPANLTLQPTSVSFTLDAGQSASQVFTVANVGDLPTDPLSVQLVNLGSTFGLDAGSCTNVALAPDAGCSVQLFFAPPRYEDTSGQLSVGAAAGGTRSAAVHGVANAVYTLTVSVPFGGKVQVNGSSCTSASCNFTAQAPGVLNASASINLPTWGLSSWTGACTGDGGCAVVMTRDQTLGAVFAGNNFAFVTSQQFNGNLGGNVGADRKCNDLARDAGLPGSYVAWISTASSNVSSRIPATAGGWVRRDGSPFAALRSDLINAAGPNLVTSLILDERGAPQRGTNGSGSGSAGVWTGTNVAGAVMTDTCNNFTDGTNASRAVDGVTYAVDPWWTSSVVPFCDTTLRLYCFETDQPARALPTLSIPAGGRRAFVTSGMVPGVDAGYTHDDFCKSVAAQAGLSNPNNFLAFESHSPNGPASRFTTGTNWYRLDGLPLFFSPTDITKTSYINAYYAERPNPLTVTETRGRLQPGASNSAGRLVWTGASTPGRSDLDCTDWSSSTSTGLMGTVFRGSYQWLAESAGNADSCTNLGHLYCFEQ
ncbi:MAG: choice-of-anchor D domain-containing protein [Archangiaceae bacterium]|nr:choice-of-anchor D domain-containing protein [Archangiaceae bacterium]